MNRWSAVAVLLAIAGALALRVPQLATRPLHNDEAVNAVKVSELWQHGRYVYDADEYHGPERRDRRVMALDDFTEEDLRALRRMEPPAAAAAFDHEVTG